MVLKRLFVTALGALGLGALTAGPAFSQIAPGTSIPAPKLYGDITSCAGGMLPGASTAKGAQSLLGMGGLLGMALGGERTDDGARIGFDAGDTANAAERNNLLQLLMLTGTDLNCDNPVANGYNTAMILYNEYVSAKAALPAADATPDADATARYEAAMMAKDSYGGDVYNEVYNQRMQLAGANRAIDAYNMLVGGMGTLAALKNNQGDGTVHGYDNIMIANFGDRTVADPDGDATETARLLAAEIARFYGTGATAGYRAIAGHDIATAGAIDTAALNAVDDPDGTRAAFNASGVLQFQAAANATADVRASTAINTLGGIVTELGRWNTAVTAAQTALDDANEAGNLNTVALQENLRRATAGRDHVQGELNRLTRIVRAQNRPTTETGRINIGTDANPVLITNERQLLDEYTKIQTRVESAANNVRSAVTALDNANKALKNQLGSSDAYLNQLVTLREYQLAKARQDQVDGGGDDAAQSLKDAVKTAMDNLDGARDLQMSHMALTGEPDSPAATLLNALLETDEDKADDGLALVRAIDAVSEDSGAVSANTEKNTEQDARLDDHDMKLMQKKEYIDNIAAEVGMDPVTGEGTGPNGMSRIDMNESRSMANAMEIGMDENGMSRIDHNESRSMANATAIGMNSGRIDANEAAISGNTGMIADNASAIGRNSGMISDNTRMIGELNDALEVVRAGVAASMALAGMPAINGRGVSIGIGSYDGESAFAVGFQIQGEMASFKVGVTSAGGETGASAGVGFQF